MNGFYILCGILLLTLGPIAIRLWQEQVERMKGGKR